MRLIDLDEDIDEYLSFSVRNPHYPDTTITTRMVLAHRSGLGWPTSGTSDFYKTYSGDSAPPLYPLIKELIVPGYSKYDPSLWKNTAPGTAYWYSNFGAALLGYLVEVVSGEDFKEYCKKHIQARHLYGFLQTPWRPTIEEFRQHHLNAIEQVGAAISTNAGK